MSRTYPLPTWPANSPNGRARAYTCPCSCGGGFTEQNLTSHLYALSAARCALLTAQYKSAGIPMAHVLSAHSEIAATIAAYLQEALTDTVPDWRDSDGLRGYAARTVTLAGPEETL